MKNTDNILFDADKLNEKVLEAAANFHGESLAPEVSPETAQITVWDETPDVAGKQVAKMPAENEENITEQLVNAGNDEAELELRLSADDF